MASGLELRQSVTEVNSLRLIGGLGVIMASGSRVTVVKG